MLQRLMPSVLLWLGVLVPFGAAGHAAALRTERLPNGIQVLLAPDPRAASVDLSVWYPAGTRWEQSGKTGLTHVVEQLMFRGGEPGYLERVERLGGSAGSLSTPDYSSFFDTVPPEALETAMRMEADRMRELPDPGVDLDDVRRLIRLNRERLANAPAAIGLQTLFGMAFEGHPYAWPAIGLAEDLDHITAEDCAAYHRDRYGPAGAVVTVVGRFDPSDAIAAARRTLGTVPRRPAPHDARLELPEPAGALRRIASYPFKSPALFLCWRVPGGSTDDWPALELIARSLAAGSGTRLGRALADSGLTTVFVQGGLESRREGGLLYAFAALPQDADSTTMRTVETLIDGELRRTAGEGLETRAFDALRHATQASILFNRQRPRDQAAAIGAGIFVGDDAARPGKNLTRLAHLTPRDVQATAAKYLLPARETTLWMMPATAGKGVR